MMFLVINKEYGGYSVPIEVSEETNLSKWDDSEEARSNPIFLKWVYEHQDDTSLGVYAIPDSATDYMLFEYDGMETLIYVENGEICYAWDCEDFEPYCLPFL